MTLKHFCIREPCVFKILAYSINNKTQIDSILYFVVCKSHLTWKFLKWILYRWITKHSLLQQAHWTKCIYWICENSISVNWEHFQLNKYIGITYLSQSPSTSKRKAEKKEIIKLYQQSSQEKMDKIPTQPFFRGDLSPYLLPVPTRTQLQWMTVCFKSGTLHLYFLCT